MLVAVVVYRRLPLFESCFLRGWFALFSSLWRRVRGLMRVVVGLVGIEDLPCSRVCLKPSLPVDSRWLFRLSD